MPVTLKVVPRPMPTPMKAEAAFESSAGPSYVCTCTWSLEFAVELGEEVIVSSVKKDRGWRQGREFIVLAGDSQLGTIRRRIPPFADRVIIDDDDYSVPWVLSPSIPELGLSFSLWRLAFGSQVVNVRDEGNVATALSLLGYMFAKSVFVE